MHEIVHCSIKFQQLPMYTFQIQGVTEMVTIQIPIGFVGLGSGHCGLLMATSCTEIHSTNTSLSGKRLFSGRKIATQTHTHTLSLCLSAELLANVPVTTTDSSRGTACLHGSYCSFNFQASQHYNLADATLYQFPSNSLATRNASLPAAIPV
jgi:hypothetical protein